MPELDVEAIVLFTAFVLPGVVSMYVYGWKVQQAKRDLKDKIVEAVSFSLINFLVLLPIITVLDGAVWIAQNPLVAWIGILLCFLVAPSIWPFAVVSVVGFMKRRNWIQVESKTAWDEFFSKASSGCWIIAKLKDGALVGGRFGAQSFASAYPEPGHLYIEELWEVLPNGAFGGPELGSPGILLRPTDYEFVRVFVE